jgi:hypothetical protein
MNLFHRGEVCLQPQCYLLETVWVLQLVEFDDHGRL